MTPDLALLLALSFIGLADCWRWRVARRAALNEEIEAGKT